MQGTEAHWRDGGWRSYTAQLGNWDRSTIGYVLLGYVRHCVLQETIRVDNDQQQLAVTPVQREEVGSQRMTCK